MAKKILVVEDELALSKALNKKFTKEGFEVVVASDGEEGLEKAEKQKPDLILLDIIMPRMDGMTMLEKMRKEEWGKDIPIILLTNLTNASNVFEAMKEGVHDYLVKSEWSLEDVVKKVNEKLNN